MLTHKVLRQSDVRNIEDTAHYYEDGIDDYYASEGAACEWQGKGAAELGLNGPVDQARFRELLDGRITPGGPRSRVATRRDSKTRMAIDLTFSAPKSVSLQALVAGDPEIVRAHDRAVARTIDVIETQTQTREKEKGKTRIVTTGKLIVAKFRHETSRETDPDLHTHAVVLNLTKRADGQWRALHNDEIVKNTKYFGAVYRAELAHELTKLGYQIRQERDGMFDLAHINRAQINAFSGRSRQIEDKLASQGLTRDSASAAEKQAANLATRKKKISIDRAALHAEWREKARGLGIDFNRRDWAGPSRERETNGLAVAETPAREAAKRAVRYAVNHLTERQAVMEARDLANVAMEHGVGRARLTDIHAEIAEQIKGGFLIRESPLYRPAGESGTDATPGKTRAAWIGDIEGNGFGREAARARVDAAIDQGGLVPGEARFTTQTALEREKRILQIERDGRGRLTPVMAAETARERLAAASLNEGQRAAAELIATTGNRVVAVQGFAGTGKSHMLERAKALIEGQGYAVRALAPYGSQVKALLELNVAANTLASFLKAKEKNIGPKTVLVIDEAGVVPTRLMEQTLKIAEKAGARVVLMGDTAQTKAIEAGRPFAQLQAAGMETARMTEIRRQTNPVLKEAVELAARGDTGASLRRVDVTEIADHHERRAAIAEAFVNLKPEERDRTLIVSGTNEARREINARVREGLGLAGKGVEFDTLIRRDTTQAERQFSKNYRVGDVIQPESAYRKSGLARGETYTVIDTGPGNRLTVRAQRDSAQISFNPKTHKKLSVYEPKRAELSPGDVVRVTRNNAALDLANGDRFKVEKAETGRVVLADSKRRIELETGKPLHLDHAYATTAHSSQGLTADRVLIDEDSKSRTTAKETYYVAISRPRTKAHIFTDDKEKLPAAIARETVKSAALDLVRERGGGRRGGHGAEEKERDAGDRRAARHDAGVGNRERTVEMAQSDRRHGPEKDEHEVGR